MSELDNFREATRTWLQSNCPAGARGPAPYPTPTGLAPGAGAIVAAIEAATDTRPVNCGKPTKPFLDVLLPVGISFYTFQTLSYTIDIYRRKLEPTRSFFQFAFFVTCTACSSGPGLRPVGHPLGR